MTLPELAIKRHVSMLMLIVSLTVLGGVALFRLPLAFMPDVEEPMLFVQLPYTNASPAQVERLIVRPVEEALGSVGGLRNMWSHIGDQGGTIGLQFDWSLTLRSRYSSGSRSIRCGMSISPCSSGQRRTSNSICWALNM